MRITPKQYAILLYEITTDVKKKEVGERTRGFLNLLLKNRALGQLPKILLFYKQYYNTRENVVDVEVVTAREVGKDLQQWIEKIEPSPQPSPTLTPALSLRERGIEAGRGGLARTFVRYSIDPAVLGGARIKVGDYMIDDTLKARVRALRNKV